MNRCAIAVLILHLGCSDGAPELPLAESSANRDDWSHVSWERLDTLAVLGTGPEWEESPLYRVSDAVLDNGRNTVFLANGGNSELIRYDIGSRDIRRIGRQGRGPGEFGRPLWMEPHGPDSLLVYDRDFTQFSVFSRSGDFGRTFTVRGIGLRGRQPAVLTRMDTRIWVGLSSGLPQLLMIPETPSGTKARDTLTVLTITNEGAIVDTVARVPHALWERLPDPTSFNIRRDEDAGEATVAGGGGRLFIATFGDSLEVTEHPLGRGLDGSSLVPVAVGGPRHGVSQFFASREGTLWIVEGDSTGDSTVFHAYRPGSPEWARSGTLTLPGNVRILDASQDRIVFLHLDSLGIETVIVARARVSR
ncbi:MAG: hypothetical protein OXH66_17805 [Gemmatimonadetes bacterium]|nr:hypothetical protein [Gemmatimonadota bacterium]